MGLVCVMYVMYTCKKIDLKEAKRDDVDLGEAMSEKERVWLDCVGKAFPAASQ